MTKLNKGKALEIIIINGIQQSGRKLAGYISHNKFSYRLLNNKLPLLCAVEWAAGWGTSPIRWASDTHCHYHANHTARNQVRNLTHVKCDFYAWFFKPLISAVWHSDFFSCPFSLTLQEQWHITSMTCFVWVWVASGSLAPGGKLGSPPHLLLPGQSRWKRGEPRGSSWLQLTWCWSMLSTVSGVLLGFEARGGQVPVNWGCCLCREGCVSRASCRSRM